MYGGFAGNETSIDQRNIAKNVTELSGDIGTPGNKDNNTKLKMEAEYTAQIVCIN